MPRLCLFGKLPRAGRVKTRLVPPLTATRAARLYRAFLTDQLSFLTGFSQRAEVAWWTDGDVPARERGSLGARDIEIRLQGAGDLGARLSRALTRAPLGPPGPTVILGADSPTLPASWIDDALERLARGCPAVIAPSTDGGYVLVGVREHRPELMSDIPWGTSGVTAATLARARDAGIELELLPPWYDVDDAATLTRLCDEMRSPSTRRRAPSTWRCLVDLGLLPVI
jgi:rSAM/selenodomain-associated transferase 1